MMKDTEEKERQEKRHEVQNRCDFIVPKNNNESSIYCINETCLEIDVKSNKMNSNVTKVAAATATKATCIHSTIYHFKNVGVKSHFYRLMNPTTENGCFTLLSNSYANDRFILLFFVFVSRSQIILYLEICAAYIHRYWARKLQAVLFKL